MNGLSWFWDLDWTEENGLILLLCHSKDVHACFNLFNGNRWCAYQQKYARLREFNLKKLSSGPFFKMAF